MYYKHKFRNASTFYIININLAQKQNFQNILLKFNLLIELEDKANVVVSVWGATFVQFLAALAVLPRSNWKKRLDSSFSCKWTEAKQLTRQGIEHILPPKQTRRPLPSLLILSFFYGTYTRTSNWHRNKHTNYTA